MVRGQVHAMGIRQSMERSHRDVLGSGVRLRIYEQGPTVANVVVCLHSLFVDARAFMAVAARLSDEYRVVCPDLPGHGDSEKPPTSRFDYSVEAFADALVQLYGGLGLRRAAIVGHGLGGSIAVDLAARHPELVTRLVLIDAICRPNPLFFGHRVLLLPVIGGIVCKQLLGRTAFRALFRDRLFGQNSQIPNSRIDAYFDSFNSPAGRGSILATLRATADTRPVLAQIVRLNVPTLVVWGRHDRFQPASIGQRLSREIRNAGFELLDSGHSPHEQCPDELVPCLRRFLRAERLIA
jgi:pimeloyl-ACP methyl ester carboxylesterase